MSKFQDRPFPRNILRKIYPVSDLVNSPKTHDSRCIEPVRIERDFFEREWWGIVDGEGFHRRQG